MADAFVSVSDIAWLYVTFADAADARALASAAIEAKLAACANVFASHQSIYAWKGKIETSNETGVIFKTTRARSEALTEFIVSRHSFEVPCVAQITPDKMTALFAQWIRNEVV